MPGQPAATGSGNALPVEHAVQITLARFQSARSEIQWRGVQRDAQIIFALTFMAAATAGIDKIGMWIVMGPLPLLIVATLWLQHDRRIGSLANYLAKEIEPAMQQYDGHGGLEKFLNHNETTRVFRKRLHFTSVIARLTFPSLQLLCLGAAIGQYYAKGEHSDAAANAMILAVLLMTGVVVLTFAKVKHVRIRK